MNDGHRTGSPSPDGDAGSAPLAERLDRLEQLLLRVGEEAALARHAAEAPERRAARAAIFARRRPAEARREGLSFLIPTWNHAGFLAEAVASADATLQALPAELRGETMVLDDASSDETPRLLAELAGRYRSVCPLRSDGRLGIGGARNVLLEICDRRHGVLLDADNRVDPTGVRALYRAAVEWSATFAHGLVVMRGEQELHARSNEPLDRAVLERWSTDMMGIVDVERTLALGGFTSRIELVSGFDQELFLRLARHGELLLFVPVLVGRYRISRLSHHRSSLSWERSRELLRRMYLQDGGPAETSCAAAHPDVGLLWASAPALAAHPHLEAALPGARPSTPASDRG